MRGEWIRRPRNRTSVVFVHGILSSGETCWRHTNGAYWPHLLTESPDLTSIGIYVFTYQTGIFSGTYRIGDVVDALKEQLQLDHVLSCEKIVFVCHSMGGIVVRKFLVERAPQLLENRTEVGLFLVASPSLGSSYANILSPLAKIVGHTQADALRFAQDNAWLNDLDKEFQNLKESRKLAITGKEIVEDKFFIFRPFLRKQVVEPFAGARYFGETFKVPGTDHFSIAKPESADAIQHRLLIQFILKVTEGPGSKKNGRPVNLAPVGHFICYSESDGKSVSEWLVSELERAPHNLRCWMPQRDLGESDNILMAVDDSLQHCESLVFVLTEGSTSAGEHCAAQWKRAVSYNKPITLVRPVAGPTCPLPLETRSLIDFSGSRDDALRTLAARLARLTQPPGQLETLREQLAGSQRAIIYAPSSAKARYLSEISALENQIAALEATEQNEQAVRARIASGIERERRSSAQIRSEPTARLRFVNAPPLAVPSYFENRYDETRLVGEFMQDPAACILTVHGRGGVGKTALACRVLRALERDMLPDDAGACRVAAVVYINCTRASVGLFPQIISGVLLTLDKELQDELRPVVENPNSTVATMLRAILPRMSLDATVVLLDNFEDIISRENNQILDAEVGELFQFLPEVSQHSLKAIVTTRVVPNEFWNINPARLKTISLTDGLASPYAESVLRKLDADGSAGLRDAPDSTLADVVSLCRGFPRALEAFYSVIKSDPSADIGELITDLRSAAYPAERLIRALVGEAYSRLLPIDQKVMQVAAIYGRPVSVTAMEYVLRDWAPYVDGPAVLKRLVAMHIIRREGQGYYLHPIDRDHSLSFLSESEKDRLRSTAADYYQEIAHPRSDWITLADVEAHLEQFRLRVEGGEAESAASILDDIAIFLDRRGAFEQKLSLARALTQEASDEGVERIALQHIAGAQWRLGRATEAISAQERLIQIAKRHDPTEDLLIERGNLLIYRIRLGTTDELLVDFRAYLAEFERMHPWDQMELATCLSHVATCFGDLGYMTEAFLHQQRATDIALQSPDPDAREAHLHNLGNRYIAQGSFQRAEQLFRQALALSEESRNPLWKANHLSALSGCAEVNGQFDKAINCIDQALEIRKDIGDLGGIASDMASKAKTLITMEEIQHASDAARAAYELARDLKRPMRSYRCIRAETCIAEGKIAEAYTFLTEHGDNEPGARWNFDNMLGTVLLRRKMREEARNTFNRSLAQCDLWLLRSSENQRALAGKALALAGLALSGQADALVRSKEAFRAAIRLETGAGTIAEWRRHLEQLCLGENQQVVLETLVDVLRT